MLRATYGDLCCAPNYVAYRAEREGASGCLRADRGLWGRRRFRSLSRQRNIFSAGLTSRRSRCGPTNESLDSADMYVEASTELKRCVLDRVGPANRQAWPVSHQPRRARGSRNRQPGRNYVAVVSPDPPATAPTFARGQHSSARNIGRQTDRATRFRPEKQSECAERSGGRSRLGEGDRTLRRRSARVAEAAMGAGLSSAWSGWLGGPNRVRGLGSRPSGCVLRRNLRACVPFNERLTKLTAGSDAPLLRPGSDVAAVAGRRILAATQCGLNEPDSCLRGGDAGMLFVWAGPFGVCCLRGWCWYWPPGRCWFRVALAPRRAVERRTQPCSVSSIASLVRRAGR